MKKYLKEIGIMAGIIILTPLIFSIFNIFEIEIPTFIYLISIITITFVSGILVGRNTKNCAYKKGIILGICFISVMFLLSVILGSTISFNMITYYLIILISCTLGSMIGIQKR